MYYILSKRKVIDASLFKGSDKLRRIVIPSSIERICNYAFKGCSLLTEVVFENHSSLKYIDDYAFNYCLSLHVITIPSSVQRIGDKSFENCQNLEKVIFETPSSLHDIGTYPFYECSPEIKFVNQKNFDLVALRGPLEIKINFMFNFHFTSLFDPNRKVEDLRKEMKEKIENKLKCKIDNLSLRYQRTLLEDGKTLSDYQIGPNSKIIAGDHHIRGG